MPDPARRIHALIEAGGGLLVARNNGMIRLRDGRPEAYPLSAGFEPGRPKAKTRIGRNVRTGIHNGCEAPVEIGDDAWIAGGSYITEDVPPESLAGFPPRQETKEGYLRGKRDD